MANNFYRLKHKQTGLYYTRGSLSEKGKVYTSGGNLMTYLGSRYSQTIYIGTASKVYKNHQEILDELDENPRKVYRDGKKMSSVWITVHADDFEKEMLE